MLRSPLVLRPACSRSIVTQTFMKPGVILTPASDAHLRLAVQAGATDIVSHYPGLDLEKLLNVRDEYASYGLRLSVIERLVPHDKIVHNHPGRDEQIEGFKTLIRNMGKAGVDVLCYNFMPSDDWTRTSVTEKDRGGALCTAFDIDMKVEEENLGKVGGRKVSHKVTSAEELWENLEYFLNEVVPVAEEAGVDLALHPDDPPTPMLHGQPQIIYNVDQIEKAVELVPSPRNGVCMCQGSFASYDDASIPDAIHRLASHIKFVHFRDVVGHVPRFRETFQDTGKTDMVACVKAYKDIGFTGVIRPDHVPTLHGEKNEHPGYEMMGRLWALGYIKGLMETVAHK